MSKNKAPCSERQSATAALLATAFVLTACAPALRVTLLPQADGTASAVVVKTNKAETVVDKPYAQADVSASGNTKAEMTDAQAVEKNYAQLLALKPAARARFTLQFVTGTSDLTPQSQAMLPEILAKAKGMEGGEIVVVGHTDSVGPAEGNDALSLQRANAVRDLFIAQGFAAQRVSAAGRGEREPVKPTPDETDDAANRRVEIEVR